MINLKNAAEINKERTKIERALQQENQNQKTFDDFAYHDKKNFAVYTQEKGKKFRSDSKYTVFIQLKIERIQKEKESK